MLSCNLRSPPGGAHAIPPSPVRSVKAERVEGSIIAKISEPATNDKTVSERFLY